MNTPPDTLAALFADLQKHDWFYMMSDDHGVWRSGVDAEARLTERAKALGEVAEKLMADYSGHVFSGETFGKERKPEPRLEDYTQ